MEITVDGRVHYFSVVTLPYTKTMEQWRRIRQHSQSENPSFPLWNISLKGVSRRIPNRPLSNHSANAANDIVMKKNLKTVHPATTVVFRENTRHRRRDRENVRRFVVRRGGLFIFTCWSRELPLGEHCAAPLSSVAVATTYTEWSAERRACECLSHPPYRRRNDRSSQKTRLRRRGVEMGRARARAPPTTPNSDLDGSTPRVRRLSPRA